MNNREMEPRLSYTVDRPPYNDHFGTVEISNEDREIDRRIFRLFRNKLIRQPRWYVEKGGMIIDNTKGEKEKIVGLEDEQISEELARVIAGFARVENFLPDYMGTGYELTRNSTGLFRLNMQWGHEELRHGLALEGILEQTGHKATEETIEEDQENLKIIWENPFSTARRTVAHRVFTERGASLGYLALRDRAYKEGAHKIAGIFELIARDEACHLADNKMVTEIYYGIDKEGTIGDILHVAREFRMPAENLHPDLWQWNDDLHAVGVLSNKKEESMAETVVYHVLKGFRFITEEEARKTVNEYLQIQKINIRHQLLNRPRRKR